VCAPAAILAVTQAGVSIASQGLAAKAQDIQAQHAWANATQNLENQYNATQLRENQEMQRTQLQVFQAQQQGVSNASRIRSQLATGGVAGASAQEREAAPGVAATNFGATAKVNLANELKQNQADAQSFKAQAQNVINENQPASGAALGLGVASTLLGAAAPFTPQPGGGGGQSTNVPYKQLEALAPANISIGGND
jgi:hypothetical protein